MKIGLLISHNPICYHMEKWSKSETPLLLITGLSGSGKTTFASKFAEHHHAICVSFDVLKFYPEASEESQKILNIFLKNYPDIKNNIGIQWSKTDTVNSNDILFTYYCNLFFDFLIKYAQDNKKKIVLEGIQMFVRLHPAKSAGLPVIIIRSSSIRCCLNKFKRDYNQKNVIPIIKFVKYLIKDSYTYHIKQRKLLNTYITYLSTINNYIHKGD